MRHEHVMLLVTAKAGNATASCANLYISSEKECMALSASHCIWTAQIHCHDAEGDV